jgi:hypothetical protein
MKRYDLFIIILKGGNDTKRGRYVEADTCQYFVSSIWAEGLWKDEAYS